MQLCIMFGMFYPQEAKGAMTMYCTQCGSKTSAGVQFCAICGQNVQATMQNDQRDRREFPFWIVGALVGATVGFLTRPAAFLVGQLPFGIVITGGSTLRGLDSLFVPVAQRSLGQMAAFAIIGGFIPAIVRKLRTRPESK